MKGKIKSITQISLCVAILSVISQITIPIGAIPITLQTFIICVVGYTMGIKKGITATVTYILDYRLCSPVCNVRHKKRAPNRNSLRNFRCVNMPSNGHYTVRSFIKNKFSLSPCNCFLTLFYKGHCLGDNGVYRVKGTT